MSDERTLPWLKVWVEMPTDMKIRMLDVVERWIWTTMLCMTRASFKAPEIWTQDLDHRGRAIPESEWRPATIADITTVAGVELEHWIPRYEVAYQGSFRELHTKQEFMTYLAIAHLVKLDMVVENESKVLEVINFTKRQYFEQDIPRSGHKRKQRKQRNQMKQRKQNKKGPGSGVPKTEESQAIYAVYEHWLEVMAKPRSMLTKQRKDKIAARLHEGFSVEDLKKAIDGCKVSPFHMGENERQTVYDDIELICRNGGKVEQFINFLSRKGGLRNVGGKLSNRYVSGESTSAPAVDLEAERRIEELRALGRGEVLPVREEPQAPEGGAGPGEGQGAPGSP
jgi:hypothetical protein